MANKKYVLPLIPLRGLAVFPGVLLHFDIGRKLSEAALNEAMSENQLIFLSYQNDVFVENPLTEDLSKIGTVAEIKQVLHMADGNIRVLVEGLFRSKITKFEQTEPFFKVTAIRKNDILFKDSVIEQAKARELQILLKQYLDMYENVTPDVYNAITSVEYPGELIDVAASNFHIKPQQQQALLETLDIEKRTDMFISIIKNEIDVLNIKNGVMSKLKYNIDKNQRDYVLREQLKIIQDELGEDNPDKDYDKYKKEIQNRKLPKEVEEKLKEELLKLSKLPMQSQEYNVILNYIETVLALPWDKTTLQLLDTRNASKILNRDHYGLTKVKERILEYIAVKKLNSSAKGTVLCLVGPPGTGKTSIVRSLAEALNRKYVRLSLGGIQNESEIRGHRKTYVGSMPGRIINAYKQANTSNPLILLDEIDKMSNDFHGDPMSAMLEVLDPEQNKFFRDNFIELPFDLSETIFIATANTVENIPLPLYDRLDIIEVSGYTIEEKTNISKKYLIPKQLKLNGLTAKDLRIPNSIIQEIIDGYTKESGVRELERKISAICRKVAREITDGNRAGVTLTSKRLFQLLGSKPYLYDTIPEENQVGIVTGLAWTQLGGDTLFVEVNTMPGSGKLELTGNLGDVMKESAKTALSFIRSNCEKLGIEKTFYKKNDIHIHIPEGAVPKDGPSAGVTMTTALISALTQKCVKNDVAMTGEITLRGRVLPIGGLREKSMAAHRLGVRTIIIPFENKKDYEELPVKIKTDIQYFFAKNIFDVLEQALAD